VKDDLKAIALKLQSEGGRALVVQTAFLGDVVLLTPLLRALRRAFPKVYLTTLTLPVGMPLIEGWVDESLTIDKSKAATEEWSTMGQIIKAGQFDIALASHRSWRTGHLLRQAGIPFRIGFRRGGGQFFHTHKVDYPYWTYEGRRNLELLRALVDINDTGLPEIKSFMEDKDHIDNILAKLDLIEHSFIVCAPASVWKTKAWPLEYYSELALTLWNEYRLPVLTVGGSQDRPLCSTLVMNDDFNLAGRLTLRQSTELMARSKFVISGDTAPAHLATAAGARQLIIYGSTTPRFGFFPPTPSARALGRELWCRPCTDHGRNICPLGNRMMCLKDLKPKMIVQITQDWI